MLALPDVPRTYPLAAVLDLTDADWLTVPVLTVNSLTLIPTQSDVALAHIIKHLNGHASPDYARAVSYNGGLYLHDGHHRWLIAVIRGDPTFPVRVLTLP